MSNRLNSGKSKDMVLQAIKQILDNPGTTGLIMFGDVDIEIKSVKVEHDIQMPPLVPQE